MTTAVQIFLACLVVLGLIFAGALVFRRLSSGGLGANANRGRLPRLAVIDAAVVDNRRKLVLVRRDNIEHLLMIGGPTDIVVEQNIVRATPQRDQPAQRSAAGEPGRAAPDLGNWTDPESGRSDALEPYDSAPPPPEPPPLRPSRAPLGERSDEGRRPPMPSFAGRRPNDPLAGFTPEPPPRPDHGRPEPPRMEPPRMEPPRMESAPRAEPALRPETLPRSVLPGTRPVARPLDPPRPPRMPERSAAPTAPPPSDPALSAADQNLADMAQRLEAALRRPGSDDNGAPPVAPEAPTRPPRASAPEATTSDKVKFENLEQEMASLLGRPPKPPA